MRTTIPSVVVCVRGSAVPEWTKAAAGRFEVRKATTWWELPQRPDAVFILFHLAERLGLASAPGRCLVHDNPDPGGPPRWITSPQLPTAVVSDPEAAIERAVTEALAAAMAYNEDVGAEIETLAFLGTELGGSTDASIERRGRAVAAGIDAARALLG